MIVLSHVQTRPLLAAREKGVETAVISLDLNLTQTEISLNQDALLLPDGQMLSWALIADIQDSELACFQVENNGIEKNPVLLRSLQPLLQPHAYGRRAHHAHFRHSHAPHQRHGSAAGYPE
ncbi:MAG: hypothetical protein M5U34_49190 [Chloroflexi bacterium]|nr:hypothetical protein [Chloroflexota bacterium]